MPCTQQVADASPMVALRSLILNSVLFEIAMMVLWLVPLLFPRALDAGPLLPCVCVSYDYDPFRMAGTALGGFMFGLAVGMLLQRRSGTCQQRHLSC